MLVIAGIVYFQLIWLSLIGSPLGLRDYVPESFWMPGYNYDNVIRFGSTFFRPNGLTMLEPSYASLFLGVATVIELARFRRLGHTAVYAGALLGTYSGSGILLVFVSLPVVFLESSLKWRIRFLLLLGASFAIAAATGVIENFIIRMSEFSSASSSADIRFIDPIRQLGFWLSGPDIFFSGIGAGNYPKDWAGWPITKLLGEYGLLSAVLFSIFFICSLWNSPIAALTVGIAFTANFSGGYLSNPVITTLLFILCTVPKQSNKDNVAPTLEMEPPTTWRSNQFPSTRLT
jgi:hypothetical protein